MGANAENALTLLEWYRAMGVDEAVADTPANWFAGKPEQDLFADLRQPYAPPAVARKLPPRIAAVPAQA